MKNKNLIGSLLLGLCVTAMFSSCGGSKVAKNLDGSWKTEVKVKDKDGTLQNRALEYVFNHDEEVSSGGSFTEKFVQPMSHQDGSIIMECKATVTVMGNWKVADDNLFLSYNLASLDVKVENLYFKIPEGVDLGVTEFELNETDILDSELGEEEMRKAAYQSLYEDYKSRNNESQDGACCRKLKVEGGKTSFEMNELGEVELTRIGGGKESGDASKIVGKYVCEGAPLPGVYEFKRDGDFVKTLDSPLGKAKQTGEWTFDGKTLKIKYTSDMSFESDVWSEEELEGMNEGLGSQAQGTEDVFELMNFVEDGMDMAISGNNNLIVKFRRVED